jgi:hypothetical protein
MITEIVASLVLAASAPQKSPHLTMPRCEIPESYQLQTAECSIEFHNDGDKPIHIANASPLIEGDSISPTSFAVPPHGAAYAQATVHWKNDVGYTTRIFELQTDEPGQEHRSAEVRGFVSTVLDQPRPILDFGVVDADGQPSEKDITLTSRETSDFRLLSVVSKPDYLDVSIGKDGKTLQARTRKDPPWGLHEADFVKVRINTPQQREAWIPVKVDFHGAIVPDSNPFALGLMRKGNASEYLIRLTSKSDQAFKVGKVTVDKVQGQADIRSCTPATAGCKLVHFVLGQDQPTGYVGGSISVELPDQKRTLRVYIWGMLVGHDTVVRDFAKDAEAAMAKRKANGETESDASTKGVDLKQAIKQGIGAANLAPPAGEGPLLKWSVAHENLVYGYLVYRADAESGPFLRINKEMIRAEPQETGGVYQWRDTMAEKGKTYWYYVGIVDTSGNKQQLSGPQKKTVN